MKYVIKIIITTLFILSCTQSNIIKPIIEDNNLPPDYEEAELDPKIYIYDESNDKLLNNVVISLKNGNRILKIVNNKENSINFLIRIENGNNYLLDKGTDLNKTQLSFTLNGKSEVLITIKKNTGVTSYPDLTLKVVCSYQNFGTYTFTLSNNDGNDPFNGYYTIIEGKTGIELKNALYLLLNTSIKRRFTYSECWDAIKYTDEDPSNDNNVILSYTNWSIPKSKAGTDVDGWNREHTWPQSRGNLGTNVGPGTDLHHLRACDVTVNSARGNREFDNGGNIFYDSSPYPGYSNNTGCKKDSDSWEPIDSLKGDVARMIFYMDIAYDKKGGYDFVDLVINNIIPNPTTNNSPAYFGKLDTLKQWHQSDLPDYIEKRRNERIYELQGNRNPFIDKPELINQLF